MFCREGNTHSMKNPQKVAFEFLAFSANFVLLKLTYLVTLFECKRSLLRSQWDFFCDFQTPCNTISLLLLISVLFCKYQTNKTSFTNHWFFFTILLNFVHVKINLLVRYWICLVSSFMISDVERKLNLRKQQNCNSFAKC